MPSRPTPPVERVDVYDYRARKSMPGRRLDGYLAAKFKNYSRSFLTSLVRDAKVTINGAPVKPLYEIKRGDDIHIELPVFARHTLTPENIPIDIIHEDDHILVINKPADIIVHPARSHMTGTLVNALVYYCDHLADSGDKIRPGIVHRLDRDTTGAMIVVKDEASRGWIGRQFEWRRVQKHYLAVVEGEVELDSDVVELPLARHPKHQEKMAVNRKDGREAISIYRVQERFRGFTLVDVELKTGRTHQIRVHMAAVGHPVVCDAQYGRRSELHLSDLTGGRGHVPEAPVAEGERGSVRVPRTGEGGTAGEQHRYVSSEQGPRGDDEPLIARQALHAHTITINHPGTKQPATYTAPLPDDMQRLLAALRTRCAT